MTTASSRTTSTRNRSDAGPPLVVLATVSTALYLAGLAVGSAMAGEAFPSPFAGSQAAQAYFQTHSDALAIGAFFQFAAAVPLAIYAATASARLRNLGIHNPGATIALVGGVLAAMFQSLSAMITWTLARPEVVADPSRIPTLHYLGFITGGPGHVVPLGLLLAGIAVPGLIVGLLPRWLAVTGLVLGAVAELSTLALLVEGAAYLLPLARFGGLAWLIIAGALLPRRRRAANA